MPYWSVPADSPGETAFIIAGGPSIKTQNLGLLRGHKVAVINRSFELYPEAETLIFDANQFWTLCRADLRDFRGTIVTCSEAGRSDPRVRHLRKAKPSQGLSRDPKSLAMKCTTITAALNYWALRGVARIGLLGADGRAGPEGEGHAHRGYPWWKVNGERWPKHHAELRGICDDLRAMGVSVTNCSPGTAWGDLWPVMSLDEFVATTKIPVAA